MVEFLAVSLLVVVSLLALGQLAVWVWTRGVAVSAAHEGARTAAEAGRSLDEGTVRTRRLLRDGLGGHGEAFEVSARETGEVVGIEARGRAPAILPFLPSFDVVARAVMHDEDDLGR
jgi:hypothetical protein